MTEENIFNNGVIYKIQCNDDNIKDFYIGSTTNLKNRIQRHKNLCNNEKNKSYNFKVYQTIRQNGGVINWNFSIIENVRCNNKLELLTRERQFYDILKPSLNINRPTISQYEKKDKMKEYNEANKEKIAERKKEYDKANKDKIKKYREVNKDKKKEYRKANKDKLKDQEKKYKEVNKDKIKEQMKEYRKANKDRLKDKMKEYREANKDKINERQRERRRQQKEQIKNI